MGLARLRLMWIDLVSKTRWDWVFFDPLPPNSKLGFNGIQGLFGAPQNREKQCKKRVYQGPYRGATMLGGGAPSRTRVVFTRGKSQK